MPFSKLIGNELAKLALQRMAFQKKVPSTLLFCGPEGVGKSRFALALAQLLMGKEHAHKLAMRNHPDLHLYSPEGKSAIHTIENMRRLIDEVALPPYEAPVKVFIIYDAHQMLPYSSNALLKTFEEPFFHSYFILLTSTPDAILPTIVSRCRKVPFFPIPQSEIATLIQNQWQKTAAEARRIAFLSHGSLAKAQAIADHGFLAWRQILIEILTLRMPYDYPQFLKLAGQLEESCIPEAPEKKEEELIVTSASPFQTDTIFEEIAAWYRDLQLLKDGASSEYLYHLDCLDRLKLALQQPFPHLETVIERLAKARLALQHNVRLRTVLEHFFC